MSRFLVSGKIVANKLLNRKGVLAILRGIWSIEMALCISDDGRNMYRISFINEDVMNKAIMEGPWSIMDDVWCYRSGQEELWWKR